MRILHTNFLRGWGGQSNRILLECLGLAERGHDITLSVPPQSELAKRAVASGLKVNGDVGYAGGARLAVLGDIAGMKRMLAALKPDIVHLHGGRDSWVVSAALGFTDIRNRPAIIRTKHNVFPISDHFLNRWQYGRFFERIVCLSNAIVEQCREKPYIDARRLVLIPSSCDVTRFALEPGTRERMRAELGIAPEEFVIAMTGRLRPEKGHAVLLDAAPAVVAANPSVRFLLIGSGSMQGELSAKVETGKLAGHITMTGFRNDIPACLSAADLYVQPSLSEGLGTSVLEACAAGLPVAASRTGGIPDVIVDGETGVLVDPGSPESLAQGIIRLMIDPDLRKRVASAARDKIAREFSVATMIERTEQTCTALLAERAAK